MAKWADIPDMIPRSQADAMVAAALEKAACMVDPKRKKPVEKGNWFHGYTKDIGALATIQARKQLADNIRALITDDAGITLERIRREAYQQGYRDRARAEYETLTLKELTGDKK